MKAGLKFRNDAFQEWPPPFRDGCFCARQKEDSEIWRAQDDSIFLEEKSKKSIMVKELYRIISIISNEWR